MIVVIHEKKLYGVLVTIVKTIISMTLTKILPATPKNLYELSLLSGRAKSKQVMIYEKGSLNDIMSIKQAEQVRAVFLEEGVKVQQIINQPELSAFSENENFINQVMTFRYVPETLTKIENETIIFDDTVAFYNREQITLIKDEGFARMQHQLFLLLWDQGHSPKLGFPYKPNHSFYNNLDFYLDGKQIIVWPDVDAKKTYADFTPEALENYVKSVVKKHKGAQDSHYFIVFLWSWNEQKMMDVWSFRENSVDDRSGPLSEMDVFCNGEFCNDIGIASGNTLLVLGYEEKLRRQSESLQKYLGGQPPALPLEIVNSKNFFDTDS